MTNDDATALYRAIDDMSKLMAVQFRSVHEQLGQLSKVDDDVDQLQIEMAAVHGTLHQHEHRITQVEGNEKTSVEVRREGRRHWQQLGGMIAAAAGSAVVGALISYLLSH